MNGQWTGRYSGSVSGHITVNIDETDRGYVRDRYPLC